MKSFLLSVFQISGGLMMSPRQQQHTSTSCSLVWGSIYLPLSLLVLAVALLAGRLLLANQTVL